MAATNTYIACSKVPRALPSALWTLSPLIAQITLGVMSFCLTTSWARDWVVFPGPLWLVLYNV